MKRRPASPATADDVLRYVAGYLEAHGGISPSFQNIGDALGIPSKSGVERKLSKLDDENKLGRLRDRARAMLVIRPVPLPRTPTGEPLYFVRIPQ